MSQVKELVGPFNERLLHLLGRRAALLYGVNGGVDLLLDLVGKVSHLVTDKRTLVEDSDRWFGDGGAILVS